MPVLPGYSLFVNQFLEAGFFDISNISLFARLTWIWPFARLHTAFLNLMQLSIVIWVRRRWLWYCSPLTYEPVAKGEIRILRLQPGNLFTSIKCTLAHVSLEGYCQRNIEASENDYQALSYTWGPAKPTATIICNGMILEVTKNLHEALLYLRHRGVENLWIDAICIDQGNPEERASQVELMKQIYDKSISLLIWLGAGTKATNEGLRLLDHLNERVTDLYEKKAFDANLMSSFSEESFLALANLLSRPWFCRAWIIQEVLSGKHRALMLCGKSGRLWAHFIHGINALSQRGLIAAIPQLDGATASQALQQLQLFQNVEPGEMDLVSLVSMARAAQATDPRDKVYALLGVAKDSRSILQTTVNGDSSSELEALDISLTSTASQNISASPLKVDYTQDVRYVYIDATKAMILSSGLQHVLEHVRNENTSLYNLPSWVPDWSVPRKGSSIDWDSWQVLQDEQRYRWAEGLNDSREDAPRYFNASRREGCPLFGQEETLIVKGIHFDTLKDLSGIYPGRTENGAAVVLWLQKCDRMAAECSTDAAIGPTSESLWRTLVADRADGKQPAPAAVQKEFEKFRDFVDHKLQLRDDQDSVAKVLPPLHDGFHYIMDIGHRCAARRFGVTHGKSVCLVPGTAVVGDLVAIIDGCTVPFVLHPVGDHFRLLGDCYVHGIMYGEAVTPVTRLLRNRRRISKAPAQFPRRQFVIK